MFDVIPVLITAWMNNRSEKHSQCFVTIWCIYLDSKHLRFSMWHGVKINLLFFFVSAVGLFSFRFLHETEFWIMDILLNCSRCLLFLWNCDVNKKVLMRWKVSIKYFSRFIPENHWGIGYKYAWNMIFEFYNKTRRISWLIFQLLTSFMDRIYYSCFLKRDWT
jgi:hypothetical protein